VYRNNLLMITSICSKHAEDSLSGIN